MTNITRFWAASGPVIAATLLSLASASAPASAQTTVSLTQYSYDGAERLQCTAERMNPSAFGSLPVDACALGTTGSYGPDRVTRYNRDATGRPLQVQLAYGTSAQANDRTYTYTQDGMAASVADANNNLTTMTYDGYDRLAAMYFPSPSSPGQSSTFDYEAYHYDANGNRTSLRKRDGRTLGYNFDALNRVTMKSVPTSCASGYTCTNPPGAATRSVYYAYDLLGHQTEARFDSAQGGDGVFSVYDGLGRLTSSRTAMGGTSRQLSFGYDADDNRTQVTFPDGQQFSYGYDGLDRETLISRQGGGGLVSTSYDAVGQISAHGRANSATSSFSYDAAGRLSVISHDLSGSAYDQSYGFGYNPASQITSLTSSNDGYAWRGAAGSSAGYQVNGLNQYTNVGGAGFGYDSNGNLTSDGSASYVYDVENRLVSASSGSSLTYDASGRLWQVSGGASGTSQFLYDGDQLAAEYDASGNLQRRYLHGTGADDPLVWYEGSGLGTPRYFHADHQGSVVAVSDASGNPSVINSYDEYGVPARGNVGRFGFTGQVWLPDLGLYHYKARIYSPKLGRFLQTDPVGYKDQGNLYAYVTNDPVNRIDPTGLQQVVPEAEPAREEEVREETNGRGVRIPSTGELEVIGARETFNELGGAFQSARTAIEEALSSARGAISRTYQTYFKTNAQTGEIYTGRTSGTGTPAQNVARRDASHHMNGQGFGPARLDRSSMDSQAIRGREQQMIERNGGAQSQGGTSGNRINGVSTKNPNSETYRQAAKREFNQ